MPRTTRKQQSKGKTTDHKRTLGKSSSSPQTQPGIVRQLKSPEYKNFKLSKKLRHPGPKLKGSFKLLRDAFRHIWLHKRLFSSVAAVYLVLNLLLVRGFIFSPEVSGIKEAFNELFSGSAGQIYGSLSAIGYLFGSVGPQTELASLYQSVLIVLFSLFMIWAFRQTFASELPRFRDVFYQSTYPLIPFIIILFIIGVQLLPLMLGNYLFGLVILSGVATTFAEFFAVGGVIFLLSLWSLYMITVSIFALYIVALPGMTPLRALRSAKGLVNHRRWTVMRKVLFLPVAVTVIGFVCMVPVIIIVPVVAEVIFLIGSAFMLPLVHCYMYSLYRELLT